MLYPLSYEGVPNQYKAPRTTGRTGPYKPPVAALCPCSRTRPARPASQPVFTALCSPPEDTRARR